MASEINAVNGRDRSSSIPHLIIELIIDLSISDRGLFPLASSPVSCHSAESGAPKFSKPPTFLVSTFFPLRAGRFLSPITGFCALIFWD